jgi:hypothetical protein
MDTQEFLRTILQKRGTRYRVGDRVFITPPNNSVPGRLFKYRVANEFLFRLLSNKEIYHAGVESFNDPLEGIKAYTFEFSADDIGAFFDSLSSHVTDESTRQAQCRQLIEHYSRHSEKFEEEVRRHFLNDLEQFGISCFTAKYDNFLMWTHYADDHRGVCLEFDFSKEVESFKVGDFDPSNSYLFCMRKVEYGGAVPVVNLRDLFSERFSPIYHKCQRFDYEEEYRSIRVKVGAYSFVPACLRGVFMGLNTPPETIDRIKQTLTDAGFDDVVLKKMVQKRGSYDLEEADLA